jgi:hypothetical protein
MLQLRAGRVLARLTPQAEELGRRAAVAAAVGLGPAS